MVRFVRMVDEDGEVFVESERDNEHIYSCYFLWKPGDERACVDGSFTIEELKAMIRAMEESSGRNP